MIGTRKAQSIIEHVLEYAQGKAQGAEVSVGSSDIATSRFANNSMTQNQSPDRSEVSVRILKSGRQCRLSGDDMSPAAVCKLVDDALAIIKYLDKDPDLLPLPPAPKRGYPSVHRYDKATADLSAAQRAKAVADIIKVASSKNLSAAGVISTGSSLFAIGNSRGLFAAHEETYAECSVTMSKGDSTGWAKTEEISFDDLDHVGLAKRAAAKAIANSNPVEIKPGKYRVILEPAAVVDLMGYLSWDFAATSHLDKLSCFLGKLDKKVFGNNISITDDCTHPMQAGAPFDGEGLPRQSVTLVENGVLKNLVYGRRSAEKMNAKPSGHGLTEPCAEGEAAQNLVFSGGNSSLEEMIACEEKAILLTRVWYIREVDPTLKIVTGMTRDGSFLVEKGEVVAAVKNLRFNQSLIELLNNVLVMGKSARFAGGEMGSATVAPPMLVDDFNFSSTTTF
jgi:PmbA protein